MRRRALETLDDQALVARAADGDRAAFAELYERHGRTIHGYVRTRVLDTSLSEDLTQEVFLRAWKAMPRFEWRGALRPWLLRMAHNRIANHWRTQGRRPREESLPAADGHPATGRSADDEALERLAREGSLDDVERALRRLSDAQREAVALRFVLELSVAETARQMGRSESAVKNLCWGALTRCRDELGDAQAAASRRAAAARSAAAGTRRPMKGTRGDTRGRDPSRRHRSADRAPDTRHGNAVGAANRGGRS